jgi:hypothetical protein
MFKHVFKQWYIQLIEINLPGSSNWHDFPKHHIY